MYLQKNPAARRSVAKVDVSFPQLQIMQHFIFLFFLFFFFLKKKRQKKLSFLSFLEHFCPICACVAFPFSPPTQPHSFHKENSIHQKTQKDHSPVMSSTLLFISDRRRSLSLQPSPERGEQRWQRRQQRVPVQE